MDYISLAVIALLIIGAGVSLFVYFKQRKSALLVSSRKKR